MYLMQLFVKASIEIDSEIPSKKRSKWRQINNIAVTFQSNPRPHIKQKSKPEKVLTKNEKKCISVLFLSSKNAAYTWLHP